MSEPGAGAGAVSLASPPTGEPSQVGPSSPPTEEPSQLSPPPTEEQKKVAGVAGVAGKEEIKPPAPNNEIAKLVDSLGNTVAKETDPKEGAGGIEPAATGGTKSNASTAKAPTKSDELRANVIKKLKKAPSAQSAPTAKPQNTQNPQGGMGGMGGMGGSGGMMGMMGVPMSTMSTNNVDLPFLKNKLIQELSAYNITDDRDMVISIIRSSDYIKELRRSLHQPTIFQDGVQDFIDGIQDKILQFPEKWKTEFTQAENTTSVNQLFHDMLKKYKDSVEEGGEINASDLYGLYQLKNNAQNCGSSPPPPHQSSNKPKGPSMFSKLKNAVTRKKNPGDPAGTPGATPGAAPDGTPKKGMIASMKEKVNNLTRKKTPEEQAEALKKKEDAAIAKKKKQDDAVAAKKQKQEDEEKAKAALAEKVNNGTATKFEKFQHNAILNKAAIVTGAKNAATAVKTSLSNAGTAVKTGAINTFAKATDPLVKAYERRKAEQAIKKYTQGGGSGNASHHRTRYISDIKHNRRRLYDREREIIQSIRNFENNNNNNRHKSRHHKTRKLRNVLMRR